jgi:hypothetical protein
LDLFFSDSRLALAENHRFCRSGVGYRSKLRPEAGLDSEREGRRAGTVRRRELRPCRDNAASAKELTLESSRIDKQKIQKLDHGESSLKSLKSDGIPD